MDRKQLVWVDPTTGQTALHLACTYLLQNSPTADNCQSFAYLIATGGVNPYHKCFTERPITAPPEAVAFLTAARTAWDQKSEPSVARLRGICFQSCLRRGDITSAAAGEFDDYAMDNSSGWLHGPNPIRLWLQMPVTESTRNEHKQIFDLLMKTGASKFLNEIDPNDGMRPIDTADEIPLSILLEASGIDLNPTALHSPLFQAIKAHNTIRATAIVNAMDRDQLDWADPQTGQTALYRV